MEEYLMALVWAAIFVTAIIVEMQTAELVAIWFVPGAFASLILSIFKVPEWIQWVVFVSVSVILLIMALTKFRKLLLKNVGKEKTDTDLLIGKPAVVVERVSNSEMTGAVKLEGKVWSARMADDLESADVGEFVTVEDISGVKLICKRK